MAEKPSIEMKPVASSNVEAVGFCPDSNCIFVQFRSGGTYRYPDCSQELYSQLCGAESAGKFVNQHLKAKNPTKL